MGRELGQGHSVRGSEIRVPCVCAPPPLDTSWPSFGYWFFPFDGVEVRRFRCPVFSGANSIGGVGEGKGEAQFFVVLCSITAPSPQAFHRGVWAPWQLVSSSGTQAARATAQTVFIGGDSICVPDDFVGPCKRFLRSSPTAATWTSTCLHESAVTQTSLPSAVPKVDAAFAIPLLRPSAPCTNSLGF